MYAYGDAARFPAPAHAHPIIGMVAARGGGYWLYTAYGNLCSPLRGAWYGSPAAHRSGDHRIVGMAATADGKGYLFVDAAGKVYA